MKVGTPIRAVLDANVVASGFMSRSGVCGQVLRKTLTGSEVEMVWSEAVLEEVGRCLRYPQVRKRIMMSDSEIEATLASLRLAGVTVGGNVPVAAPCPDPDDLKYLAAALDGLALYVVTGDNDLLGLGEWEGIRIVSPREFLNLLNTETSVRPAND